LALLACVPALAGTSTDTPQPTEAPAEPTPAGDFESLDDLVEALRALGLAVEIGDRVPDALFNTDGYFVTVNGETLQVFVYDDAAAREAESSQITPYGQPSSTVIVEWIAPPHFWAQGSLIVWYVGNDGELVNTLTSALGEPIAEDSGGFLPPSNPAVTAAIDFLGAEHGLAADEITVVSVEAVDWTDSCLGLGGAAESCLQAITPGYRIMLDAAGVQYEARTDADGTVVRIK
jgi:hypothetical protein